jgi:hypothetical protein
LRWERSRGKYRERFQSSMHRYLDGGWAMDGRNRMLTIT